MGRLLDNDGEFGGPQCAMPDTAGGHFDTIARWAAEPIVSPAIAILEGLGKGGGWELLRDEPAGLWRDLRPSEALELRSLVDAAVERAEARCKEAIGRELVTVALQFAAAHPDLPLYRPENEP